MRRDFTINAMFYNLNTKQIEDLTGRGMHDLNEKLIRTPLAPQVTFTDDPLRILRAIRFVSRYNFSLDGELQRAASKMETGHLLGTKVSRERIYKECEGCMSKLTSRPYMAFNWMHRLDLLDVILPIDQLLKTYPLVDSAGTDKPVMMTGTVGATSPPPPSLPVPPTMTTTVTATTIKSPPSPLLPPPELGSQEYISSWKSQVNSLLLSLNILLTLRQQNLLPTASAPASTSTASTSSSPSANTRINNPPIRVCADMLSAPKHPSCVPTIALPVESKPAGSLKSPTAQEVGAPPLSIKTLFWSTLIVPLRQLRVLEKKKEVPFTMLLLKEGLKMENLGVKNVQTMLNCVDRFRALAWEDPTSIVTAGMLLRDCKELWRECSILACACELAQALNSNPSEFSHRPDTNATSSNSISTAGVAAVGTAVGTGTTTSSSSSCVGTGALTIGTKRDLNDSVLAPQQLQSDRVASPIFFDVELTAEHVQIIKKYETMCMNIMSMDLDNVWLMRPLIDGKTLTKLLGIPKGPMVGKLMEEQIYWQIKNARSDDEDACIAHLKEFVASLT
mmetsp:Transcript_14371/g.23882  ORF Transcript_14371/g.23882 Transcript_14371/m.23882 type:complete len:562 (-) Transcript_14371:72-1757(-)